MANRVMVRGDFRTFTDDGRLLLNRPQKTTAVDVTKRGQRLFEFRCPVCRQNKRITEKDVGNLADAARRRELAEVNIAHLS